MKQENIENNNEKITQENTNNEQIIKEIIEDIRPYLNSDGGDIEFIKYEDNYVFVKLYGACSHCGYQDSTLNDNILEIIKEKIPEVIAVINVEI